MDLEKVLSALVSLFFGFLGGFAVIVTMKNDIQMLKQQHRDSRAERSTDREDRDRMYAVFQAELREMRQSQERHYMNLVSMLQGRKIDNP